MIYQFPGFILPIVIAVDIMLIVLVSESTEPKKKFSQRLLYGLGIFGFIGFGMIKLLFTVPHGIPSTPVDLNIETNTNFTSLYYLGKFDGKTTAFWKEYIIGQKKDRYFDLESSVSDGLIIAKKFDDIWYAKTIKLSQDKVSKLSIDQTDFVKANPDIKKAIAKYKWTEAGNYISVFLAFSFIITLAWRIIKYGL